MTSSLRPDRLLALAILDRLSDGSPVAPGRWSWGDESDYTQTRAAILDTDAAVAALPPLRGAALRSAVAHALICADWYADALRTGDADDDAKLALEAAIDAIPFLCPLPRTR